MSRDAASLPFARLPELLERLYDSLASFLDAKLALFRKEVLEEGQSLIRRCLGVAVAGLVALVGFMVLTAALVLGLDSWIGNLSLSCLIVGVAYFAGGAGMAVALARDLAREPLHATGFELEKDKQWIRRASDT
jgi:uncharacterized membrane protein YqjE